MRPIPELLKDLRAVGGTVLEAEAADVIEIILAQGPMKLPAPKPEGDGCCTLPENHPGACVWICGECHGSGKCWACQDEIDTCTECSGTGSCPAHCDNGKVSDEL